MLSQAVEKKTKRLYLESYGCQMNEYDSAVVRSILEKDHYEITQDYQTAELILLNTCAIREKAHEKIYHRLESFVPLKKKNPQLLIGVLGCMAQSISDDLFAMGLPLDFSMGPDNYRQLPEVLAQIRSKTQGEDSLNSWSFTQLSRTETYDDIRPQTCQGKKALLTIMRGCDNFCSFCVVPYTRGRERSRSPESIVDEVRKLVEENDAQEITLLGQNVNSYKWQSSDPNFSSVTNYARARRGENFFFTDLIAEILAKTTIQKIRFTSPHPHDFPVELLDLMAGEERFCSQIHLPLQSGSSTVLKRMKRDYNRSEFKNLVAIMRERIPDLCLTTDIIVGFCAETNDEFEETLQMVDEVRFDMAYMFYYSERKNTWASKHLPDDVPETVKKQRLSRLIAKQQEVALSINKALLAKKKNYRVLVEGFSRRSTSDLMGRTDGGKVVVFPYSGDASSLLGTFVEVGIDSVSSATLKGHLLPITTD